MSFLFNDLLSVAIKEWPDSIDLSNIIQNDTDSSVYAVVGLGRLADDIGDRYIGLTEEIIFRNLHLTIFSVLHDCGKYVKSVEIGNIRPEYLRKLFNQRLLSVIENKDLDYDEDDKTLVKNYLSANF